MRSQLSPALNASETAFWFNPGWQAQLERAWALVGRRFRDDSGVAGYDLFNEPHFFPYPPVRFDKDVMWPYYARSISALGRTDPFHLFLVQNDMVGDFATTIVPLRAPDLVYAPHIYTGALVPPENADPVALRRHIDEMAGEASRLPAAFWVGEWGIAADQPGAAAWVDAAVARFDALDAGWAWWQWRQDGPWGLRSLDGSRLDVTLLRHLARPYPVDVPPGAVWSAGSAGMRLQVPAAGPLTVVLAWPAYLDGLPRIAGTCPGAAAAVREGRITLTLPAQPGCLLTVTPSG